MTYARLTLTCCSLTGLQFKALSSRITSSDKVGVLEHFSQTEKYVDIVNIISKHQISTTRPDISY